ncbi:hypothetical protein BC829DRAFT_418296 [Chytridium lagenaria]|nr:hypothetical protein BC829DRAFT_418296 [Chytridium lagenaria]
MTNGLADIVRRQNRQTLILSGNPVTLASAIISTEDFRTIASKDVALKPTAMGTYVTSSATATGTLQKTAEEKGGISETPIGHAMAPNTTSFSMSMPSSMSAPNFCTLPSIPSEPTPKQNPASGSNFVISSLNLPTSSYLSTPPSNPRPASNRSTPSLNTSINIDPFQPIIQKVEPLLSQGRAQELYDSIANFLIPYRLIFRDPHIELLFRSFSSSSDALSNAQHSLCGVVILWILIATAILSDAHDDSISLPPPTYIYIACGFAFAQLFIVIYQIHQSGWSPRSTLKKPQSEKTLTSYAMTPTPSTKASHLTSLGYIINLTPVFGSCITLCLFSSYGRLFDQARGSMAQNFVIYAAFIKNGAMGFVERVAVLSVLMIIILVSSAIYVEFHVYDILTTVACHCLLLVVVHRMECVMRTDFLLRETLMVSKAVSDRQTKVSTGLLNAILPQRIMKKLIQNIDLADKSVIIDFFDCISVIHTDITSFTVLSSKIQPDALIKILNTVFSSFDKICRAHGVEKILTVGDAYIAAHLGLKDVSDSYTCQIAKSLGLEWDDQVKDVVMGDSEMGLPKAAETSRGDPVFAAALSCRTALSMIAILEEMAGNTVAFAQVPGGRLLIRAGVHSGTARGFVTGGYTKIKYELFGDAVDVAEKVQELATPGMVFASKFTTDLLADQGKFDVDPVLAGMLKDGTECHHIRGLSSDDKNIGLLTSLKYM